MPPSSPFDLSICIPTYNRISSLRPLVTRLLTCADPRIEVVVLDNASTDGTLEVLRAIPDPRLTVHGNPNNRGVIFNVLNVLDKAQGRYAVLLLDKDDADPMALPYFRKFLMAQSGLACGYCEYGSHLTEEAVLPEPGMPTLRRIAYLGHHPTGYFFDTVRLRSLDYLARFSDVEFVGHFPLDFIFAELLVTGRGAIYHRPVFAPESESNAATYKSIGTNAAREDAFFSPPGRLKTAVRFCRHIATLQLDVTARDDLVIDRFIQGMMASTTGYRSLLANPALCAHYHIASRRIGSAELVATALRFYLSFVEQAVADPALDARRWRRTRFHLALATRLVKALTRRLMRHSATTVRAG